MSSKLFVGNLPFRATDEEIRELFAQHGLLGLAAQAVQGPLHAPGLGLEAGGDRLGLEVLAVHPAQPLQVLVAHGAHPARLDRLTEALDAYQKMRMIRAFEELGFETEVADVSHHADDLALDSVVMVRQPSADSSAAMAAARSA